jgi:hypothetical protein
MRIFGGILLFAMVSAVSGAQSAHRPPLPTLSSAEKTHILDGQFSIERDVDRLPKELKVEFARLAGEKVFEMANPGKAYQSTDVIMHPRLPWRRLLFAGISDDKIFVLYEKGGFAHTYHLAVFHLDPKKKIALLWLGSGTRGAISLEQLRTMVSAGQFADDRPYYW